MWKPREATQLDQGWDLELEVGVVGRRIQVVEQGVGDSGLRIGRRRAAEASWGHSRGVCGQGTFSGRHPGNILRVGILSSAGKGHWDSGGQIKRVYLCKWHQ